MRNDFINKKMAATALTSELCLYDTEQKVLYLPDVSFEPYCFHGIQEFHLTCSDQDIRKGVEKYGTLADFCLESIPAHGSSARSEFGYSSFTGFLYAYDDVNDIPNEEVDKNITDFLSGLEKEGLLRNCVIDMTETNQKGLVTEFKTLRNDPDMKKLMDVSERYFQSKDLLMDASMAEDKQVYDSVQEIVHQGEPAPREDMELIKEGKATVVDGVSICVHGLTDVNVKEARNYIRAVCDKIRNEVAQNLSRITITREADGKVTLDYDLTLPKFERIRRITGYLVGDTSRWNNAKLAEEHERVKHTPEMGFRQFVQATKHAYDAVREHGISAEDAYVQQTFLSLCEKRGLEPASMAASLLASEIEAGRSGIPSAKSSFAEDFLSVCKLHGVAPMEAAKMVLAKFGAKQQASSHR